jgi:xylulokinase
LDEKNEVIRPAILWNDSRSFKECDELMKKANFVKISGNIVMPGFTAPKLRWIKKYEPENFKKAKSVLLPKDYINFLLTGNKTSDMSDASGTLWLDVEGRKWSEELLKATNLSSKHMPKLYEGNEKAGLLKADLCKRWKLGNKVIVAAGAGDNAASAIGVGAIKPGDAFVSLGTSGVLFVVTKKYQSQPQSAVHTFCHAVPNRWHQMSVMLSAASCLKWYCNLVQAKEQIVLNEAQALTDIELMQSPLFLPYLSGERTPYNNPHAKGVFLGITHTSGRGQMAYSVIEGVSFGIYDGLLALKETQKSIKQISILGGGSQSDFWAQLLADILNIKVLTHIEGQSLAAVGASRLAAMACGISERAICTPLPTHQTFLPNPIQHKLLMQRYKRFKLLYKNLTLLFI